MRSVKGWIEPWWHWQETLSRFSYFMPARLFKVSFVVYKSHAIGLIGRETIIDVTNPTATVNIQGCAIGNFSIRFRSPIVVSPCVLIIFCLQESPLKKCEDLGNRKEPCTRFVRTSIFWIPYVWLYSSDHHYVSEGVQCLQDFKFNWVTFGGTLVPEEIKKDSSLHFVLTQISFSNLFSPWCLCKW